MTEVNIEFMFVDDGSRDNTMKVIKELAEKKYQITLALSLHAPTDEKRKQIMPVANS